MDQLNSWNVYIKLKPGSELGKVLEKLKNKYSVAYIKKEFLGQIGRGNGEIIKGIIDSSRRISLVTMTSLYKSLRDKENYRTPISRWIEDVENICYCRKDVEKSWLLEYLEAVL